MKKDKGKTFCYLKDEVILKKDCQPIHTDLRCGHCPQRPKIPVAACEAEDADKMHYEVMIKPLLEDIEVARTIVNLPSKEQIGNTPEEQVSDESFFDLIKKDWQYLFTPLGWGKVARWMAEKWDEDSLKASKARDNLRRTGEVLAFKVWDKPAVPKVAVAFYRECFYKILKESEIELYPLEEW